MNNTHKKPIHKQKENERKVCANNVGSIDMFTSEREQGRKETDTYKSDSVALTVEK